jgi:hypothetical protein
LLITLTCIDSWPRPFATDKNLVKKCVIELDPLMPEEMEKAIREISRDAEVIDLLKKLSEEGLKLEHCQK